MRMTQHSDYALRMLIYLAIRPDGECTANDVATAYALSRNHLAKVAQTLRDLDLIETTRGRKGGLRLRKSPDRIGVGALIRATETDFALAECMQKQGQKCAIASVCKLTGMLQEALDAYLAVLDKYTLADILKNRKHLAPLLGLDFQGEWQQTGSAR